MNAVYVSVIVVGVLISRVVWWYGGLHLGNKYMQLLISVNTNIRVGQASGYRK